MLNEGNNWFLFDFKVFRLKSDSFLKIWSSLWNPNNDLNKRDLKPYKRRLNKRDLYKRILDRSIYTIICQCSGNFTQNVLFSYLYGIKQISRFLCEILLSITDISTRGQHWGPVLGVVVTLLSTPLQAE